MTGSLSASPSGEESNASAQAEPFRSEKLLGSNMVDLPGSEAGPDQEVGGVKVKRVGVVGSGIMGSGVAEVAAKAGFEVVLRSRTQSSADAMFAGLERSLAKQVERGKLEDGERTDALERVRAVTDLGELAECDLVLESIVEDLAHEEAPLHRARPRVRRRRDPGDEHVHAAGRRDGDGDGPPRPRLRRALLQPRAGDAARRGRPRDHDVRRDDRRGRASSRGVRQDRRRRARTRPGFVVNALLFPYLNNAVKLLDAGVATRDDIDAAMKGGCNFPMGPLELVDLVGLDTSLAILDALYAEFRDPNYAPAPLLRRMVSAERYGRKSGQGFYDYRK